MKKLIKSKKRVKLLGEVFTPKDLVLKMLDKLPEETWEPDKTFLEPSCGTGNFIVEIVQKKIKSGSTIIEAISTTYGIDIMKDNIDECRSRVFQICIDHGLKKKDWQQAISIIKRNIIVGNALKLDIDKLWND